MNFESFNRQDNKIEKPKTLQDYYDRLKSEIDRLEKLSIKEAGKPEFAQTFDRINVYKDELARLDNFVNYQSDTARGFDNLSEEGKRIYRDNLRKQPITEVIAGFAKLLEENNVAYKDKFGQKSADALQREEKQEATDLAEANDILEAIVFRMERFSQGQ